MLFLHWCVDLMHINPARGMLILVSLATIGFIFLCTWLSDRHRHDFDVCDKIAPHQHRFDVETGHIWYDAQHDDLWVQCDYPGCYHYERWEAADNAQAKQ